MIQELQSLAALASSRPEVELRVGESECNWSFNWSTRIITVNPLDLALRPPDYCRGLILHESAHAALTRLGDIVPAEIYQANLHLLLNVIEDCRIENWLQLRFPGCRPWIRLYNDRIFCAPDASAALGLAADPAGGFLAGLLDRWWNGRAVLALHPESESAIAAVWPHFLDAVASYPNPEAPESQRVLDAYDSHPVSMCFRSQDRASGPTASECLTRMTQHQMWQITWRHIVPVFLRLLEHPDSEPTRQRIQQLALESAQTQEHSGTVGSVSPSAGLKKPARHSRPRHAQGNSRTSGGGGNSDGRTANRSAGAYTAAVIRHAALIESCAAVLLRFLTADSRPKRSRYHRSGCSLDLKVAMQFEADPRQHERLWQRVTLPTRPDPAFVVLIDASGSMDGEKAEASFAALVVLREVCLRLGIPLSIIRFNNRAELLQSHECPNAPGVIGKLAALLQPDGGTCMETALEMAARILASVPNRHRHLWILSDGATADPDKATRRIAQIRRSGINIHGLGLGPDSKEIATLIPGSPTDLSASRLPPIFTRILRADVTLCG